MGELLSYDDSARIRNGVLLARKMRRSALEHGLPLDVKEHHEQEVLADAEVLAVASANLVVGTITASVDEKRVEFDDTYALLTQRYQRLEPYNYSGAELGSSLANIQRDALALADDGEKALTERYTNSGNRIPLPLSELLSPQVGVIAPMSTDYQRATLHTVFVHEQMRSSCFELKPAAVNISTKDAVLPKAADGQQIFHAKKQICVYIDLSVTGRTRRVVFSAVKEAYPRKKIYGSGRKRKALNS